MPGTARIRRAIPSKSITVGDTTRGTAGRALSDGARELSARTRDASSSLSGSNGEASLFDNTAR